MMNLKSFKVRTQEDAKKYDKILLFGAGNYVEESIETFGVKKVEAIFDNDKTKWGESIKGIPVLEPKLHLRNYIDEKKAIILSTSSYQYDIAKELVEQYGVCETQIFSMCPDYQESRMYNAEDILKNIEQIEDVFSLLSDDASRDFFYNSLVARLTHNPLYLKGNPCMKEVYYYQGENADIRVRKNDCIIDCGAYIGDTAQLLLKMTENTGKIYCFEPFEGNFLKLEEWINKSNLQDKIKAYCIAVSDFKGVQNISAEEEISTRSNIRADAKVKKQVAVNSIDNLLIEFDGINFIKMDIEGEELNALNGAQNAIRKYQPQMMISAYHKTSHLWEIPLLLHSICPTYKIYLGHNPKVPFEPEFYFSK